MKMVPLDEEIHAEVRRVIGHRKMQIDYPTIKFYINRAVKEKLQKDQETIKTFEENFQGVKELQYDEEKHIDTETDTETF
jgi:hypothetical protein